VREKVFGFLDSPEAHWGSVRTRGVSLDRYVERWIREELPSDPMSETMKRRHIEFYRHHIAPSLGAKNIRNITTSEINRLLHHTLTLPRDIPSKIYKSGVRENVTLSSATRKNVFSTLSKIFTQATTDGVVVKNPMKGVNKVEVTPLKKENIELAISDVNKTMKWIRKNAPEDFCQYGLQFLGLRRAERLGLTWDKIEGLDTKNPKIVVGDSASIPPGQLYGQRF
jgi:integrase